MDDAGFCPGRRGPHLRKGVGDDNTRLNALARNVGAGKLGAIVSLDRNDEIGDLAKAFSNMQTQLFTDRLTGIANREAIVPRIEDRIIH